MILGLLFMVRRKDLALLSHVPRAWLEPATYAAVQSVATLLVALPITWLMLMIFAQTPSSWWQ